MSSMRRIAATALCTVVVATGAGCTGGERLPTMTLGSAADGAVFEFPTTAELIDNSYVVARGRFTGAPDIVWTSPEDGGVVHHLVVWEFVPDEVPVNASHLEELLQKARERDAEVAAIAQGADFAGDADPYRTSEDDGEAGR